MKVYRKTQEVVILVLRSLLLLLNSLNKNIEIGIRETCVEDTTAEAKLISRCGFVSYKCVQCDKMLSFLIINFLHIEKVKRLN